MKQDGSDDQEEKVEIDIALSTNQMSNTERVHRHVAVGPHGGKNNSSRQQLTLHPPG